MKTRTRIWTHSIIYNVAMTLSHMRICIFVKRLSCLTHLAEMLEAWTRLLDEEIDVIIISRLLQAFDSIARKRLMMKIFSYGIEKQSIASVASFLSNREITVTVRQQASASVSALSGGSQGSVLVSLLFW